MSQFLRSRGGAMDFGKFTTEFKGVKKAQVEDVFVLEEEGNGRLLISLPGGAPGKAPRTRAKAPAPEELERIFPASGEERFEGTIMAFDTAKGYGFIKCGEITQGDVYFKRSELEPEDQRLDRAALIDRAAEFDVFLTPDGKARADRIILLHTSEPPPRESDEARLPRRGRTGEEEDLVQIFPASGDERFEGIIIKIEGGRTGYGFIKCDEVTQGDIYFKRSELDPQDQGLDRAALAGRVAEFDVFLTPDGKPRADRIVLLHTSEPPPRDDGRGHEARPPRKRRRGGAEGVAEEEDMAPLSDEMVQEMKIFLEDNGGSEDWGKFTNQFKGIKKAQLQEHFVFLPGRGAKRGSGHWRIALEDFQEQEDPNEDAGADRALDEVDGGDDFGADEAQHRRKRRRGGSDGAGSALPPAPAPPPDEEEEEGATQGARRAKDQAAPPPPLGEELVQEITEFLEAKGGSEDFGKLAAHFKGVKKVQLQEHFSLWPERGATKSSGRWRIGFESCKDQADPNDDARDDYDADEDDAILGRQPPEAPRGPIIIAPSPSLWLIGYIRKWDVRKGYGFIAADGADDVFVHKRDLPPELQSMSSRGGADGLQGVEFAFELHVEKQGKLRASQLRALLTPDGRSGWQVRRG